jgi:3-dehydroquinate dehydratase-1
MLLKTVEIQGVHFGAGLPKLCIPLTGQGVPALLSELQFAAALPADLYEWRIDCFFGDPLSVLPTVLEETKGKPLLCTLRTEGEGGKAQVSPEEYERQITALLRAGGFGLVDLELAWGEERVTRLVNLAKEQGIGVVISKHDFEKTPPTEEIAQTLVQMKKLGADLPKYAVMPQNPGDVLALLSATWKAYQQVGPVITMAMGELGKVTRAAGGVFGSCLTFGAGQNASAPGQMEAEDLRAILEDLQPYDGSGASPTV